MNITFLVGNGFDIAAGANTSYRGFYEWYCEQPDERLHIQKFKEAIQQDIANGGENWSDFELGLGQYTDHFTPENIDEFWDCYDDAQEKLVKYLKQEEDKLQLENFNEQDIKSLRAGFFHLFEELSDVEKDKLDNMIIRKNTTISFISFNYTFILDVCLKECAKSPVWEWKQGYDLKQILIDPKIIHVHGTIEKHPIIGVNDISQIENKKLLSTPRFEDSIVKSAIISSLGSFQQRQAKSKIEHSDIVCIFGMSRGETDSYWWQFILNELLESKNFHLIIFCYEQNPPDGISTNKYKNAIADIISDFTSWIEISEEDKLRISKQIHVIFNTKNVLQISLSQNKK